MICPDCNCEKATYKHVIRCTDDYWRYVFECNDCGTLFYGYRGNLFINGKNVKMITDEEDATIPEEDKH